MIPNLRETPDDLLTTEDSEVIWDVSSLPLEPELTDDDGYTSTDSITESALHRYDWRLHQVKTQSFVTNPGVTQYWHYSLDKGTYFIEHQVLNSARPVQWSVFRDPYNFHLKLDDISQVSFARGSKLVLIMYKLPGWKGQVTDPTRDTMAQFKRDRTQRRFLNFLRQERGIKIVEEDEASLEARWNESVQGTLPGYESN
ncbi:hypothetical protein NEMBOFW57_004495 [Staphylotrichum longicolle]|uniref:Uncharacterized protein n=1 Tax=Staphylotrichum longicolle TaxID=669026 RepID=A0AAD4I0I8_9PEZI|nr:hypothetical protein NEMBOFW57_004495 [Staphylotrichum longicolle]